MQEDWDRFVYPAPGEESGDRPKAPPRMAAPSSPAMQEKPEPGFWDAQGGELLNLWPNFANDIHGAALVSDRGGLVNKVATEYSMGIILDSMSERPTPWADQFVERAGVSPRELAHPDPAVSGPAKAKVMQEFERTAHENPIVQEMIKESMRHHLREMAKNRPRSPGRELPPDDHLKPWYEQEGWKWWKEENWFRDLAADTTSTAINYLLPPLLILAAGKAAVAAGLVAAPAAAILGTGAALGYLFSRSWAGTAAESAMLGAQKRRQWADGWNEFVTDYGTEGMARRPGESDDEFFRRAAWWRSSAHGMMEMFPSWFPVKHLLTSPAKIAKITGGAAREAGQEGTTQVLQLWWDAAALNEDITVAEAMELTTRSMAIGAGVGGIGGMFPGMGDGRQPRDGGQADAQFGEPPPPPPPGGAPGPGQGGSPSGQGVFVQPDFQEAEAAEAEAELDVPEGLSPDEELAAAMLQISLGNLPPGTDTQAAMEQALNAYNARQEALNAAERQAAGDAGQQGGGEAAQSEHGEGDAGGEGEAASGRQSLRGAAAAEGQPEAESEAEAAERLIEGQNVRMAEYRPADLTIDADRFQYKISDSEGRTGRLSGPNRPGRWNAAMGGVVAVYEAKDGKTYVVDGHQRVNLAKELEAEGHAPITLPAHVLREEDWTGHAAKIFGALINIGADSQSENAPLDAALAIQSMDGRQRQELLDSMPAGNASAHHGLLLAAMHPKALELYRGNFLQGMQLPPNQASAIGEELPGNSKEDLAKQLAALKEMMLQVQEAPFRSRDEALNFVRQMKSLFTEKPELPSQPGLLDDAFADHAFRERARIVTKVANSRKEITRTFNSLKRSKGVFEALSGQNRFEEAESRNASDHARAVLAVLNSQVNAKGPVADALNSLALEVKAGKKSVDAAASELADVLVESIEQAADGGIALKAQTKEDLDKREAQQAQAKAEREAREKADERKAKADEDAKGFDLKGQDGNRGGDADFNQGEMPMGQPAPAQSGSLDAPASAQQDQPEAGMFHDGRPNRWLESPDTRGGQMAVKEAGAVSRLGPAPKPGETWTPRSKRGEAVRIVQTERHPTEPQTMVQSVAVSPGSRPKRKNLADFLGKYRRQGGENLPSATDADLGRFLVDELAWLKSRGLPAADIMSARSAAMARALPEGRSRRMGQALEDLLDGLHPQDPLAGAARNLASMAAKAHEETLAQRRALPARDGLYTLGFYSTAGRSITLNMGAPEALLAETLVHEAAHALTARVLSAHRNRSPGDFARLYGKRAEAAALELDRLMQEGRSRDGAAAFGNAFSSPAEFVAEAFGSSGFQAWLRQQKDARKPSLWERFVNAVLRLFGMGRDLSRDWLRQTMDIAGDLFRSLDARVQDEMQDGDERHYSAPTSFFTGWGRRIADMHRAIRLSRKQGEAVDKARALLVEAQDALQTAESVFIARVRPKNSALRHGPEVDGRRMDPEYLRQEAVKAATDTSRFVEEAEAALRDAGIDPGGEILYSRIPAGFHYPAVWAVRAAPDSLFGKKGVQGRELLQYLKNRLTVDELSFTALPELLAAPGARVNREMALAMAETLGVRLTREQTVDQDASSQLVEDHGHVGYEERIALAKKFKTEIVRRVNELLKRKHGAKLVVDAFGASLRSALTSYVMGDAHTDRYMDEYTPAQWRKAASVMKGRPGFATGYKARRVKEELSEAVDDLADRMALSKWRLVVGEPSKPRLEYKIEPFVPQGDGVEVHLYELERNSPDGGVHSFGALNDGWDARAAAEEDAAKHGFSKKPRPGGTEHRYPIPGAENYREVILRLPDFRREGGKRHFGDAQTENIVAWLRLRDIALRHGGGSAKVLVVEEVQSDWGQAPGDVRGGVPFARKDGWMRLVWKQALMEAVQNDGYEALAWFPSAGHSLSVQNSPSMRRLYDETPFKVLRELMPESHATKQDIDSREGWMVGISKEFREKAARSGIPLFSRAGTGTAKGIGKAAVEKAVQKQMQALADTHGLEVQVAETFDDLPESLRQDAGYLASQGIEWMPEETWNDLVELADRLGVPFEPPDFMRDEAMEAAWVADHWDMPVVLNNQIKRASIIRKIAKAFHSEGRISDYDWRMVRAYIREAARQIRAGHTAHSSGREREMGEIAADHQRELFRAVGREPPAADPDSMAPPEARPESNLAWTENMLTSVGRWLLAAARGDPLDSSRLVQGHIPTALRADMEALLAVRDAARKPLASMGSGIKGLHNLDPQEGEADIYLIADQIESAEDAVAQLAHEAMHFASLRIVDDWNKVADGIDRLVADGNAEAIAIREDMERRGYMDADRATQAKEFIAIAEERRARGVSGAQAGDGDGGIAALLKRLWQAFRRWLESAGFGKGFLDGPVGDILRQSRAFLKSGRREGPPSAPAREAVARVNAMTRRERALARARALPMDHASRMARARDMGFHANPDGSLLTLYIGMPTQQDIGALRVRRKGKHAGLGSWLTSSPLVAYTYAGRKGQIHPVAIRGAYAEVDAAAENWDSIALDSRAYIPGGADDLTLRQALQQSLPARAPSRMPAAQRRRLAEMDLELVNEHETATLDDITRILKGHPVWLSGVAFRKVHDHGSQVDIGERTADTYAVFDPQRDIRSVNAAFDPEHEASEGLGLLASAPASSPFYDPLLRAAREMRIQRGTPAQMLNALRRGSGVKEQFIEWTMLPEWLAETVDHDGKVGKQHVVNFLEANGVRIETTVISSETLATEADEQEAIVAAVREVIVHGVRDALSHNRYAPAREAKMREYRLEQAGPPVDAQWHLLPVARRMSIFQSALESGWQPLKEYIEKEGPSALVEVGAEAWSSPLRFPGTAEAGFWDEQLEVLVHLPEGMPPITDARGGFYMSHFDQARDPDNIILHILASIRKDDAGRHIFFVDEIQSDTHQQSGGRYENTERAGIIAKEMDGILSKATAGRVRAGDVLSVPLEWERAESGESFAAMLAEDGLSETDIARVLDLRQDYKAATARTLPALEDPDAHEVHEEDLLAADLPFKGNEWVRMGVKAAIKTALDRGADGIAFNSAHRVGRRYLQWQRLTGHVHVKPPSALSPGGFWDIMLEAFPASASDEFSGMSYSAELHMDTEGRLVNSVGRPVGRLQDMLEDPGGAIWKGIARLLARRQAGTVSVPAGALIWREAGNRKFYGETLPSIYAKEARKLDPSIRPAPMDAGLPDAGTGLAPPLEVMGFMFTPALRRKFEGGIPLYSAAPGQLHAVHNIHESKLLSALELGGLPAPSVAVRDLRHGIHGSFGGISLFAAPSLVLGRGARVYDADVYSATVPAPSWKISESEVLDIARQEGVDIDMSHLSGLPVEGRAALDKNETMESWLKAKHPRLAQELDKDFARRVMERRPRIASEFRQWADAAWQRLNQGKRLFNGFTHMGNRRYLAWTMDNILRQMKRSLVAHESDSVGSIRAGHVRRLSSVRQMRQASGKLVSDTDFEAAKEESHERFFALADRLRPFFGRREDNTFIYLDNAAEALQGGMRRVEEYFNLGDGAQADALRAEVMEFLDWMRAMPTTFFEAKFSRGVGLDEFVAAAVPKSASREVKEALRKAGLEVHEYSPDKDGDRARAYTKAARRVLFSRARRAETDSLRQDLERAQGEAARFRQQGLPQLAAAAEAQAEALQREIDAVAGRPAKPPANAPADFQKAQDTAASMLPSEPGLLLPHVRDNMLVRYEMVDTGSMLHGMEVADTPEKVAHIFAPVRKRAHEQSMMLVTDEAHRPLAIVKHSTGLADFAPINPAEMVSAALDIPGARHAWLGHQHPSGSADPSQADQGISLQVQEAIEAIGSGLRFMGHIVVGAGGRATWHKPLGGGKSDVRPAPPLPARRGRSVPLREKSLRRRLPFAAAITGPDSLRSLIDRLGGMDSPKHYLLLMDSGHAVVGVVPFDPDKAAHLRSDGGAEATRIAMAVYRTGAVAGALVTGNAAAAKNLFKFFNKLYRMDGSDKARDFRLLDWYSHGVLFSERTGAWPGYNSGSDFKSVGDAVPAGQGMPPAAVGEAIAPMLKAWRSAPLVRIAATPADLPAHLQDALPPGREAKGAYDSAADTVWLVASQLRDAGDAMAALRHEAVGHFAFLRAFRDDAMALLDATDFAAWKDPGLRSLWAQVVQDYPLLDERGQKLEMVARMAEMQARHPLLDRIAAMLARIMRAMGALAKSLGPAELRDMLRRAASSLRAQRPERGGGLFESFRRQIRAVEAVPYRELAKWKMEDWRAAGLYPVARDHLEDLAREYLPTIVPYMEAAREMSAYRNELQVEAGQFAARWHRWAMLHPKEARALDKLRTDATIAGVDPAEGYEPLIDERRARARIAAIARRAQRRRQFTKEDYAAMERIQQELKDEGGRQQAAPALLAQWQALSPQAQEIYRTERDFYARHFQRVQDALSEYLSDALGEEHGGALVASLRLRFEKQRMDKPYFPLMRHGDYWVRVSDPSKPEGERYSFHMFESRKEQALFMRTFDGAGAAVHAGKRLDGIQSLRGVDPGFLAEVMEALDGAPDPYTRSILEGEIYQLYLRRLPELSMRKHFLHREKVPGFHPDGLRAFSHYMFHGSFQLARLKVGKRMEALLREMMDDLRTIHDQRAEDALKAEAEMQSVAALRRIANRKAARQNLNYATDLINRLLEQHEWAMSPKGSAWAQKWTSFAFLWYLGLSPSAAIVNLTQVPMFTLPWLGAKYGYPKAQQELARAYRDFLGSWKGQHSAGPSIFNRLKGEEAEDLMALFKSGDLTRTLAHDLAGLGEEGHMYSVWGHTTMAAVSWMFHHAERMNREVTALAAYRMARMAKASRTEAVKEAGDTVRGTQYNYESSNKPQIMHSDPAKVIFIFKQFAFYTIWLLGRTAYLAMRGRTKAEKGEMRRRMAGILALAMVFAGMKGLPLVHDILRPVLEALFDDDDDPWIYDTEFRNALVRITGTDIAASAFWNGPFDTLTGVSISERVALNNLLLREPLRELEGADLYQHFVDELLGPGLGTLASPFTASALAADGHYGRAAEAVMPKFLKDAVKAGRYALEGVRTLRGDPVQETTSIAEEAIQAAGFLPHGVAEKLRRNRALGAQQDRRMRRRRRLLDRLYLARFMEDREMVAEAERDIRRFNAKNREVKIDYAAAERSKEARNSVTARTLDGLLLNPKLGPRLRSKEVLFGLGRLPAPQASPAEAAPSTGRLLPPPPP